MHPFCLNFCLLCIYLTLSSFPLLFPFFPFTCEFSYSSFTFVRGGGGESFPRHKGLSLLLVSCCTGASSYLVSCWIPSLTLPLDAIWSAGKNPTLPLAGHCHTRCYDWLLKSYLSTGWLRRPQCYMIGWRNPTLTLAGAMTLAAICWIPTWALGGCCPGTPFLKRTPLSPLSLTFRSLNDRWSNIYKI